MTREPVQWEENDVILREITAEDTEMIVEWRSASGTYRFFKNPRKITREEHILWFTQQYMSNMNRFDFIVCTPSGEPVGSASAVWKPEERKVEVSYLTRPECRRQGWAQKALRAVCRFSQGRWPVREFVAVVHRQNTASAELIKGQGFTIEAENGVFCIYRKAAEK